MRVGRTRTKLQIDFYNLLNVATVLSYNQIYSPVTTTWLAPQDVLDARSREAWRDGRFLIPWGR